MSSVFNRLWTLNVQINLLWSPSAQPTSNISRFMLSRLSGVRDLCGIFFSRSLRKRRTSDYYIVRVWFLC